MAEKIWVTVQSSPDHPTLLAVQDAMQQVYDVFEIAGPTGGDYLWNLFMAQRSNPFVVGGEAVSLKPGIDIAPRARHQKARLASRLRSVVHGRRPRDMTRSDAVVMERILKRNTNGIGKTEISFGAKAPSIVIDETRAQRGLEAIKLRAVPHVEVGSIEGFLRVLGFHYSSAALVIRDRRTNVEVTCIVNDALREKIARAVSAADVWNKRRVIVRGRIRYTSSGIIDRIDATDVEIVTPRQGLTPEDLYDPEFTSGLDTGEYLDRLREGELGG